jgi:hypothetical protein
MYCAVYGIELLTYNLETGESPYPVLQRALLVGTYHRIPSESQWTYYTEIHSQARQ